MDEETITTPIPKCRLYWCFFVWGGVEILQVLNLARNRMLNSCRIWSTTQHNIPPHSHTLSVFTVRLLWEGGRGGKGKKEKVEGQQFIRGVENQHD
jgi:hypothetical protein